MTILGCVLLAGCSEAGPKRVHDLPALPEPRSSHDAALVGDVLFVVGGWNMQGKDNAQWHTTAWSLDLSASSPKWIEIAKPPFTRRAVATVAHDQRLFVIGGMNEKGGPTRDVMVYDPAANSWHEAGQLQGEQAMAGFGAAGWSIHGKLIVTTFEGSIQCWEANSNTWQVIGKTKDARFFHRLLPLNSESLISIGGANMSEGKYAEPEVVGVTAKGE